MDPHRPTSAALDRKPADDACAPYYRKYIDALSGVGQRGLLGALEHEGRALVDLLRTVPVEREEHRYEEGKWSVREVVGHVIDAERIFAARALHFARGGAAPMPGFDENAWAAASNAADRPLGELAEEMEAVRRSTVLLFGSFTPAMVDARGVASGQPVTVRAVAWIAGGHAVHHARILRERYGLRE